MLRNSRGMSLVQTLVSLAISVVSIAAIAGIMSKTFGVARELDIQALMDTRHSDLLHRAGSLNFLRNHFSVGEGQHNSLESCLKGVGSACSTFAAGAAILQDAQGDFNSLYGIKQGKCTEISSDCVIGQNAQYRWICPSSNECTDLQLNLETKFLGRETRKIYKNREHKIIVPARSLTSRGDIDFSCTANRMLIGIDYKKLKGQCANLSGVLQTSLDLPAKTIGSDMEGKPSVTDCGTGISEVGLFSNKSICNSQNDRSVTGGPKEPAICSPADLKALSDLLVQIVNRTVQQVAANCIDTENPKMEDSLPESPRQTLRFKNTCGNRYCAASGFSSGRVIEFRDGQAAIECRHEKAPVGFNNPCIDFLAGPAAPMQKFEVSQRTIQNECIDEVNPTVESSDPSLGPTQESRFILTCGARSCVKRGFADGRVVELFGGIAYLECYSDLNNIFTNFNASVDDIATNCIDEVNPTKQDNLPDARPGAHERFMMTCGNRYCIKKGYRSGSVIESYGGNATLRCLK